MPFYAYGELCRGNLIGAAFREQQNVLLLPQSRELIQKS